MPSLSIIFFGVVGLILALVFTWLESYRFPFHDKGECNIQLDVNNASLAENILNIEKYKDQLEGECFFSENYDSAYDRFEKLVSQAGGQLRKMHVVDDLYTQVAIFPGKTDEYLVHMAGTHGIEAYAGSAVQHAMLYYLSSLKANGGQSNAFIDLDEMPTIIMIHVVNPYGFKNNRRVNEDNIDLNRNFLTDEQFAFVRARDPNYARFVDLDKFLNPTKKPSKNIILNEIISLMELVIMPLYYGFNTLKTAMVSGNYHKQTGYAFGGFQRAQSVENLIELLVKEYNLPSNAKKLALIDVHTGLGPTGVDTLMFEQPSNLEDVYPTEYVDEKKRSHFTGGIKHNSYQSPVTEGDDQGKVMLGTDKAAKKAAAEVSAGYELTIGMTTPDFCTNFLAPNLPDPKRLCVTQEFGTVPALMVGKNALDEQYAHFYGSAKEKKYYQSRYKQIFYVETKEWKRNIVRRGLLVFLQTLKHMREKM